MLAFLSQIGNAQRFGIEGGLNISKPSGSRNNPGTTALLGLQVGPVVEFSLTERVFLNSGVLYTEKGYKFDVSDLYIIDPYANPNPDPGTLKYKIGYIEIPLLLVYKISLNENRSKLFLRGGPTISYSCTEKKNVFDYGLNPGIGIEKKNIKIGLNYDLGLKNIWPGRNRVFQISAAYLFSGERI